MYNQNDLAEAQKLQDERLNWIRDLGAVELTQAAADAAGFLFGYETGEQDYLRLVGDRPNVRDRPEERRELVRLDNV